jgi:hypothetical protein
MSTRCTYHIKKHALFLFIGVLFLLQTGFAQSTDYQKQFRVKENVMYITVPKKMTVASLDSFIRSYNLADMGLYAFIQKGRTDSLIKSGWNLDPDSAAYYTIFKKMTSGTDLKKSSERMIFSSIPISENLRVVGGNRVVYGRNKFRKNQVFKQEKEVTYFFLKGHADARSVKLAGSFTNWQYGAFPMSRVEDGWVAAVRLEPGQYYYKFILNEHDWMTDPANLLSENDGRGNINSVYFVPNKIFFLKGYQNATSVFLTGSFNNWAKNDIAMEKKDGGWIVALYLETGTHHFHFLVDGKIVKEGEPEGGQKLAFGKSTVFLLKGYKNAQRVMLAGNFNDWKPDDISMERSEEGWKISYVLGPGNYQYKFIIDGNWITDPANPNIIDDGKGNLNSFMVVDPNYTFRLKGYGKARKVNLAGDFNDWSPEGLAMIRQGDEWVCPVYLGRGKHLYKFVVDGKWIKDPANPLWEDEFENSIVWIE